MSKFTITADMFDFSNTADLPEDLQSKFNEETQDKMQAVAAILKAAKRPLNINQVMAVWSRMGLELPTQTTIRSYLAKAVENGMVVKTSRQFYAYADSDAAQEAIEEPAEAPADTDAGNDVDPLDGLDLE